MATPPRDSGWTLLSNHGKVLVCVARDPQVRVSDIAQLVGIKERAVQRILAELRHEGLVSSTRDGRRNRYSVNRRRRMPWARDGAVQVGRLIDALER
ncbi:MAG: helix-turn-helix transcriptional regulator [Thermoleophilaceae bacterium]